MNDLNQNVSFNNTYRTYVIVGRIINNTYEMYLANSIGQNNPGKDLTSAAVSLDMKLCYISQRIIPAFNFLLFYSNLKNQRDKNWDDHEVVLAKN